MQVIVILMDETATSRVVIYCGIHHMTDQGETSGYETTSDPVQILRPGQSRSWTTKGDETAERNWKEINGLILDHRLPDAGVDRNTSDDEMDILWEFSLPLHATVSSMNITYNHIIGQRIFAVEITRLDPGKQVQWRIVQPIWETEAVNQKVTWTLEPYENSTLVDCVMNGWSADDEAYPSVSFKWATFMMRLKIFLGDLREFTNYSPLPGLQVTA